MLQPFHCFSWMNFFQALLFFFGFDDTGRAVEKKKRTAYSIHQQSDIHALYRPIQMQLIMQPTLSVEWKDFRSIAKPRAAHASSSAAVSLPALSL